MPRGTEVIRPACRLGGRGNDQVAQGRNQASGGAPKSEVGAPLLQSVRLPLVPPLLRPRPVL